MLVDNEVRTSAQQGAVGLRRILPLAVCLAMVALAASANADPLKCQRTIAKEAGAYAKTRLQALQRCGESLV